MRILTLLSIVLMLSACGSEWNWPENEEAGITQTLESKHYTIAINTEFLVGHDFDTYQSEWEFVGNSDGATISMVNGRQVTVSFTNTGYYHLKAYQPNSSENSQQSIFIFAGNPKQGTILTDTTWALEDSPIVISDTLQIEQGKTLTIEPGVEVVGSYQGKPIEVYGSLNAQGTENAPVIFSQIDLMIYGNCNNLPNETNISGAYLNGVDIDSGYIYQRWGETISCRAGSLNISESNIEAGTFRLDTSWGEHQITHNSIAGTAFSIEDVQSNEEFASTISNNNFDDLNGPIRMSGAQLSKIEFANNTFENTNELVISLDATTQGDLDASTTYWGTTDPNVVQSMIWDRNDSLSISSFVVTQALE